MSSLEVEYKINESKVRLVSDVNGLKAFITIDDTLVYIVDSEDRVIYSIAGYNHDGILDVCVE